MNTFDAAVLSVVVILGALGFRAGLLRSLADILGFVVALPLAVSLTPHFAPATPVAVGTPSWGQSSFVFFGLFLVGGFLLAQLMRYAIGGMLGQDIHVSDRLAGFLLGVVRALLVAITVVLVFDRMIPQDREPEFLKGSKVRPILSLAADRGLQSLPPDITDHIDRLKRERRL